MYLKQFYFLIPIFLIGCAKPQNPIEEALRSKNPKIKRVVDSLSKYEVQILFTEVEREESGQVNFKDYSFQVDDSTYFYPASTVKFPVALLAIDKLESDSMISLNSKFFIEGDSLITTFSKEIQKIFAVSDNDAYNRLFEYLGQDTIAAKLYEKGITARISHRLSTADSENITTKPLVIYVNDSTTITTEEIINKPLEKLVMNGIQKGRGYVDNDKLIYEPKDFSTRNYLPLHSLHRLMKQFIFPENYPKGQRFHLSEESRNFMLEAMKAVPADLGYPPDKYYDSYGKFLVFGDSKESIDDHIDIYNKVGYAYGYLTDCAYIMDKKQDKEWIITATIYVNKNGIFNDDVYEYDSVGIPFLAELGRQLIRF